MAFDEVSIAQPHFVARREAKEFLGWVLHEIVALDEELAAERDPPHTRRGIVGMIDRLQLLELAFGIVLDHDFQGPQHRHAPQRRAIELFADTELQHADIDHAD